MTLMSAGRHLATNKQVNEKKSFSSTTVPHTSGSILVHTPLCHMIFSQLQIIARHPRVAVAWTCAAAGRNIQAVQWHPNATVHIQSDLRAKTNISAN